MRFVSCSLAVLVLLQLPCLAEAQTDPDADGIGVFFAHNGSYYPSMSTTYPFQEVTGYLCATNVSAPGGIAEWRGSAVTFDPNVFIAPTWSLPYDAVVSGDAACRTVTDIKPVLPAGSFVVLGILRGFVSSTTTEVRFYIDGCPDDPAWPHNPTYQPAGPTVERRPLYQNLGSHTSPIGFINFYPHPGEQITWGSVKALYE